MLGGHDLAGGHPRSKMNRCVALASAWLLAACNQPATLERALTYELLRDGDGPDSLLALKEFDAPVGARTASNTFSGRLILETQQQDNYFALRRDTLSLVTPKRPDINQLPVFDFAFIQDGDSLVPVTPGPVPNHHGWWEFVFGTGRVWDEQGDKGWSRASIPFALKERREDCIHNGVMSFVYRTSGDISNVVFQITNQTCQYLQFEMSGILPARYEPESLSNVDAVLMIARQNRETRIPVRSIVEIGDKYPDAKAAAFGAVDEIDPADMSLYGFVIDGVHYVSACNTHYGDYPFCNEMALPSYSTAKSVVGGLGLMLLESAYPGAASAPISELVPECAMGWEGTTIEHALDMTTGHFGLPDMHGDEDSAINGRFFSEDHAGKIDVACNGFPRKAEPGTHLSYHTWDTYLAGTAMNAFLKRREGPDADFFDDLLVAKVWKPLGLSRLAGATRRSYDEVRQPYTGFGLTLLRDDVARLAQFIGPMDGRFDNEDLLDRRLFDAIKQRVPGDPGMVAELETIRYNNGFRSFDISSYVGCEQPVWVVVLSGFGGIIVAIMPNDTVYYYFSDGDVHRYLSAVRESHRIRPMCE